MDFIRRFGQQHPELNMQAKEEKTFPFFQRLHVLTLNF